MAWASFAKKTPFNTYQVKENISEKLAEIQAIDSPDIDLIYPISDSSGLIDLNDS